MEVEAPHATEAEQVILGTCMARPQMVAEFAAMLTPEMFYDTAHGDIFQAIIDRWQSNEPCTPEFIIRDFRHDERFVGKNQTLDLRYIIRLKHEIDRSIAPQDTRALAGAVVEMAARRSLLGILDESRWDLEMNPAMTAQDAIDKLAAQQMGAMEGFASAARRESSPKDALLEYMFAPGAPFVASGLESLDAVITGFRRGNSIIIGGRPSMGKTALAVFLAYMAARRSEPTVFYSYEMTLEELTARLVSLILAVQGKTVPYTAILGKRDRLREMEDVKRALDHLERCPLVLVNASGMTVESLRADVQRQKTKFALAGKRLGMAVVDYLGLIAPTPGIKERIQQIGHISRGLKAIAKHIDIPMVTLAQLNRANEQRQDKRPQLSDLRESGDIEQDADTVIFVHRESYYLEREGRKKSGGEQVAHESAVASIAGEVEFLVPKNRHGAVKTVLLGCDLPVNNFYDIGKDHYAEN